MQMILVMKELQQQQQYGVQFHPEACNGPQDANHLFEQFINNVKLHQMNTDTNYGFIISYVNEYPKVLLGSGGLSIGQAGEFDYSGSKQ